MAIGVISKIYLALNFFLGDIKLNAAMGPFYYGWKKMIGYSGSFKVYTWNIRS